MRGILSNIDFPLDENEKLTPSLEKLKNSMENHGVEDYTVIEKNGVKIGVFGIMGKEADSNAPITDFEAEIIYHNGHELKEWLAIAEYLKSFEKQGNTPKVPEYYSDKQGRKVIDNNKNIIARLKNPNKIAWILYGIILLLILIIVLIIKLRKRRKKKSSRYNWNF